MPAPVKASTYDLTPDERAAVKAAAKAAHLSVSQWLGRAARLALKGKPL